MELEHNLIAVWTDGQVNVTLFPCPYPISNSGNNLSGLQIIQSQDIISSCK